MPRKKRVGIPKDVAAHVLFMSDRTCCVCRSRGKPVQIHHIDDDPSNHDVRNLAVLCFDCHRDTQIRGGFDRKIDGEQVTLYRDDFHRVIGMERSALQAGQTESTLQVNRQLELATSLAEILRERKEYWLLATHYDGIGNHELRDKYIDKALENEADDETICFLRGLQDRPDRIPPGVIEREMERLSNTPTQRGRLNVTLHQYDDAVRDYVRGVEESLTEGRTFTAAFYLKELVNHGLIDRLFQLALREATDNGDLWWQVRALQELGWKSELDDLILSNAESIEESKDPWLQILLASAKGDEDKYVDLRKELASGMTIRKVGAD